MSNITFRFLHCTSNVSDSPLDARTKMSRNAVNTLLNPTSQDHAYFSLLVYVKRFPAGFNTTSSLRNVQHSNAAAAQRRSRACHEPFRISAEDGPSLYLHVGAFVPSAPARCGRRIPASCQKGRVTPKPSPRVRTRAIDRQKYIKIIKNINKTPMEQKSSDDLNC